MILIRPIALKHSSSNKVKILNRLNSFISRDLILTYLFIRPGTPKMTLFLQILLQQLEQSNKGSLILRLRNYQEQTKQNNKDF